MFKLESLWFSIMITKLKNKIISKFFKFFVNNIDNTIVFVISCIQIVINRRYLKNNLFSNIIW